MGFDLYVLERFARQVKEKKFANFTLQVDINGDGISPSFMKLFSSDKF